jgi:hypothetical protein
LQDTSGEKRAKDVTGAQNGPEPRQTDRKLCLLVPVSDVQHSIRNEPSHEESEQATTSKVSCSVGQTRLGSRYQRPGCDDKRYPSVRANLFRYQTRRQFSGKKREQEDCLSGVEVVRIHANLCQKIVGDGSFCQQTLTGTSLTSREHDIPLLMFRLLRSSAANMSQHQSMIRKSTCWTISDGSCDV